MVRAGEHWQWGHTQRFVKARARPVHSMHPDICAVLITMASQRPGSGSDSVSELQTSPLPAPGAALGWRDQLPAESAGLLLALPAPPHPHLAENLGGSSAHLRALGCAALGFLCVTVLQTKKCKSCLYCTHFILMPGKPFHLLQPCFGGWLPACSGQGFRSVDTANTEICPDSQCSPMENQASWCPTFRL